MVAKSGCLLGRFQYLVAVFQALESSFGTMVAKGILRGLLG